VVTIVTFVSVVLPDAMAPPQLQNQSIQYLESGIQHFLHVDSLKGSNIKAWGNKPLGFDAPGFIGPPSPEAHIPVCFGTNTLLRRT